MQMGRESRWTVQSGQEEQANRAAGKKSRRQGRKSIRIGQRAACVKPTLDRPSVEKTDTGRLIDCCTAGEPESSNRRMDSQTGRQMKPDGADGQIYRALLEICNEVRLGPSPIVEPGECKILNSSVCDHRL